MKIGKLKEMFTPVLLGGFILVMAISFNSCNEDGEVAQPTLAGTYVMQKITLAEDLVIGDVVILPSGTDVTVQAGGGIAESGPCDDKSKTVVDLRDTKELYFACLGEDNESKAGSWEENASLTKLTLNLSSPPLPTNLSLVVNDITYTPTSISGSIASMPVDPALFADLIPEGVTLPPVLLLSVDVDFLAVVLI